MTVFQTPAVPAHCNARMARHRLARWGLRLAAVGLGMVGSAAAWAQMGIEPDTNPVQIKPAHARIGIERIRLPGDEGVGLLGTSYLIGLGDSGFYAGPAAYSAFTGRRGGLYTFGGEVAYAMPLGDRLRAEVGLYAGGGGGSAAPVGGGLMLRPHADLVWDLGGQSVGVSLSRVRFPNGAIDSTQLGLVWNIHSDFRYVAGDRLNAPAEARGRPGVGFDRIQAVGGVYRPRPGVNRLSGSPMPANVGYVGVRAEQSWGRYGFWGVEANGAATGGVGGYAEFLGTVGLERAIAERVHVGGRLALGTGGGGDVDVGGGLLAKASVYTALRISRQFAVALEGGYTRAPQGGFRAPHASASLIWILDDAAAVTAPTEVVKTEFSVGTERYNAQRKDGTRRNLDAVVLKINRFVTPEFYLTGQAHSAYIGGAGAYSAGYFGVGWSTPLGERVRVGAELLAGAAAGGGVDTAGGAIVQPMAYLGVRVTPSMSLRVGAGHIRSLRGGLASPVVDATLTYTYGLAGRTAPR